MHRVFNCIAVLAVLAAVFAGAGSLAAAAPEPKAPPLDKDHAAKMARGLDLFKKQVGPILSQRCLKCHGGKETEGALDISDRETLLKGGDSGPALIPGRAKDSLLYKLISHAKEPKMPFKSRPLTKDEIAAVATWIDLGAPYHQPLIAGKTQSNWNKTISAEARQLWSFQPLKRVELPPVKDQSWCHTTVDRFILAKLESAAVRPNRSANKRQLIRRAYFGLIGLPPTPEVVEAFVNDPAADAYEKVIDRLLSSGHYGERWARYWLDLARFGESHGFEHDYDRPTAYHYRDFVIQALNQDLPYDTFVKWQIAGDEVAANNNLALMATGFLAAGVHSTQITKNEAEKHRYDEMDDMLATIGTSMLGLTIGCARCHDHKYDAIPQGDYYRLVSTFTTTVRSEVELDFDPVGYRQAKARFDKEHAPFEAAVSRFEKEQLPKRFAQWRAGGVNPLVGWMLPEITAMKSAGGATFTKKPDGSVLISGKNPTIETLTFTAETTLPKVTAIRLEAMSDSSLVKGGPGRAANGNFALTSFRVTAAPKKSGKPVEVKLKNPRATFEQKGLGVAGAIDADPVTSGWAVDPQFGKDHAAAFDCETPVGFEGGTILNFTLTFHNNVGHGLGRPRLSLSASATPPLTGTPMSAAVQTALQTPADKRTPEQTATLLNWYRHHDAQWQELDKRRRQHLSRAPKPDIRKVLISSEGLPPVRLNTQGEDFLKETHYLRRGDPNQRDGVANQSFLQALMFDPEKEKNWQNQPPKGWRTSYRRKALADWLTDTEEGAGRLLARVIVNRLWQFHMGRGLVATPSDFGTRGEPPTHPELLDWLATELIRNGWTLKPIHKLIMSSAVYQQSSHIDEAKAKVDRDNKLLWRRPRQRLEAEVIRDTLLAVGDLLDPKMYGPGTLDENSRRRSIYFTIKRSKLMPMMTVFDAPEGLTGIGERPTTTIAPQALLLMNNPNVRNAAKGFARRIAAAPAMEDAVRTGYLIALARPPSPQELADTFSFVTQQIDSYRGAGKGDGREAALADFCQVLMCLNEFVYVD